MNILCQGEHTVDALAQYGGLSVANVSRHLQILKAAHLVKVRRSGKYIYYIIADEQTSSFFNQFKDFAANRLAEIRTAFQEISASPSRLQPVSLEELKRKIFEEDAIIIDVRPEEEFLHEHIPGAVSLPLSDIEKRINKLPKNKEVVAYCRGRFCILGDQAVEILISEGFSARRADDGVIEWKLAGLSVEGSKE
jgi:rhodanese-related sulfurtransferase